MHFVRREQIQLFGGREGVLSICLISLYHSKDVQ